MDRSVFSLIEPLLHLPFMGWIPGLDHTHQAAYDINFGRVLICFQIAYGVGFLFAGRIIDKLGTKTGYALAILIWGCASISHSLVTSVAGFCIARVFLGLGESGNFPAAIKATTEWFPSEERALATGLFNSGSNASAFIAPVLIAAVTARWGWHAAFISTGSMGLIWAVIWLIFPYNKLRRGATQTQINLGPRHPGRPNLLHPSSPPRLLGFLHRQRHSPTPSGGSISSISPSSSTTTTASISSQVKYPLIVIYTVCQRRLHLRRLALRLPHEARPHRQLRPQNSPCSSAPSASCPSCSFPTCTPSSPTTPGPPSDSFVSPPPLIRAGPPTSSPPRLTCSPPPPSPPSSASAVPPEPPEAPSSPGSSSHYFSLHPLLIFTLAAFAYVVALAIFQLLVPRLGVARWPHSGYLASA